VTYEKGNKPEVTTIPFLLDVSPPETNLSISPKPFSPDNDGIDDELTIRIGVKDASRIESWNLKIFDPQKSIFTEFAGTGIPTERIIWDGKGRFGELVYSAEDYPVLLTVQDVLGNVAVVRDTIPVDVLVLRDGDKLKIQIANINFAPNSSEFETSDPAIVERNTYVLKRLAVILNKYKSYRVTIEGHAVITRFADPKAAEKEQNEELLPLSKARAETVRDELVRLGVSKDRLSVTGVGGAKPLVPHSDLQNRWKNRRVEFILEK
jgi:outer membrane protein OmpA-like peptidoglycan-associated protein